MPDKKNIPETGWEKKPAVNPRYEGKTAEDVIRALLRGKGAGGVSGSSGKSEGSGSSDGSDK